MLKKLRDILNTYTDEEIEDIDLWIDSTLHIENILIDEYSIDLITNDTEIKINGSVTKEGNK